MIPDFSEATQGVLERFIGLAHQFRSPAVKALAQLGSGVS
jgi:hypothetical protein